MKKTIKKRMMNTLLLIIIALPIILTGCAEENSNYPYDYANFTNATGFEGIIASYNDATFGSFIFLTGIAWFLVLLIGLKSRGYPTKDCIATASFVAAFTTFLLTILVGGNLEWRLLLFLIILTGIGIVSLFVSRN